MQKYKDIEIRRVFVLKVMISFEENKVVIDGGKDSMLHAIYVTKICSIGKMNHECISNRDETSHLLTYLRL